jgi:hypothetical protein
MATPSDDEARREENSRAEELLRRFNEDQARRAAEKRAREEEARRQREAEEAVLREQERARAEALARSRAEEEARKKAGEEQRVADEAREREKVLASTLAEAEKMRKEFEERALKDQRAKEAAAQLRQEVAERTTERTREPGRRGDERGRRTVSVVFALLVIAVVILHFVSFDGSSFERAAAARLGVPVKIGATRFSTLPLPALHFERVTIGPAAEVKIDKVTVKAGLRMLLDAKKHFAVIEPLWEAEPGDTLRAERLIAHESRIEVPGHELPAFNAEAKFDGAGALRTLQAETADRSKTFSIEKQGGKTAVTYSAKPFSPPLPGIPQLDDFSASGTLTPGDLVITNFDASVLGGSFVGSARLAWATGWSLDGSFVALSMDPAKLARTLVSAGRLEGKGTFSMRAPALEQLADSARLDTTFAVHRGTLPFVALTRALQSGAMRGGKTPFEKMDGTASVSRGATHLSNVRLRAGLLTATGEVGVDPQQNLDGRFRVEIASQASAAITLGGTVDAPVVKR